jgi:hypothetical protein
MLEARVPRLELSLGGSLEEKIARAGKTRRFNQKTKLLYLGRKLLVSW